MYIILIYIGECAVAVYLRDVRMKLARSKRLSYLVKSSTRLKIVEHSSILLFKFLVPLSEYLELVIDPIRGFGSLPNALAQRSFRGVEVHSRFDFEALRQG